MNGGSAPGPDGFGPSFYRAAWNTVKPQVMQFLSAFHRGTTQLERINWSYMVLLPKKPGTATVDAFRPICLQNCSIKIAAKSLTTKLQAEISSMIDLDQTAQGEIHFRKFCVRHGTGASVPQKESPNNCAETRFRQGFRHC